MRYILVKKEFAPSLLVTQIICKYDDYHSALESMLILADKKIHHPALMLIMTTKELRRQIAIQKII